VKEGKPGKPGSIGEPGEPGKPGGIGGHGGRGGVGGRGGAGGNVSHDMYVRGRRRSLFAYVGIVVTFVAGIGYVQNEQSAHRREDRQLRMVIAANNELTISNRKLGNEVCEYEWYNYRRRIVQNRALFRIAQAAGDMAAADDVRQLVASLVEPICPEPADGGALPEPRP
jgi:hypothetical protein